MTRLTGVLVLSTALVFGQGSQDDRSKPHSQDERLVTYGGFSFVPGHCDTAQSACASRVPKAWSNVEIDLLKKAINELVGTDVGKEIAVRTQQRGLGTLRRYEMGLIGEATAVPGIAATLQRNRYEAGIAVHDRFFANRDERDSNSGKPGYLIAAQRLAHECMHAVDEVSHRPEFLELVGFVRAGDKWTFRADTQSEITTLMTFDRELSQLERQGEWMGQWRLNRRLALSMRPIRVPSMQSIRGPAEAFAEIGSHLILDPTAKQYLPVSYTEFFERNVFKRSRPQ